MGELQTKIGLIHKTSSAIRFEVWDYLETLKNAQKQKEIVLTYFQLRV
jgi:hypothetical protein